MTTQFKQNELCSMHAHVCMHDDVSSKTVAIHASQLVDKVDRLFHRRQLAASHADMWPESATHEQHMEMAILLLLP